MNHLQQTCDLQRLEEFLQGSLSGRRERELTSHLDECASCRHDLEAKAAEPAYWQEASELLAGGYGGRRVASAANSQETDPRALSLQIKTVLATLAPTDDPMMLGRLGAYEISGVVGAGGMGVVLKAHDRSLDRTVAIKVMAPHLASSGSARARFAREAKAAAAVLHPNVIAIHGVSNDQTLPYLVMPYVRGASLQKRIDSEGPLPLQDTLRIGAQIAAGLAAAHAQGLVHRDIKPANMLLEDSVERVAITDFGLARAVDDATMTRSGVIAGTPQYMSPEQARGEAIDQRSDLFSLGSVLYAICTGRPPFRAETTYGVIRRIADDEPTPIRDIHPDVPEWLCQIIAKLMAKRPADRFASAGEVAELLEQCLAHVQQPATVPLPTSVASLVAIRSGRPPIVRLLVATALAFSLIWAGFLIVLELNKGKLTIQCEADDVPIRIMQGEQVVEQLTVTRSGKSVRIAAGNYQVEVEGNIDGIVVAGGNVSLKRGGIETVRIVRSADASDSGKTEDDLQLADIEVQRLNAALLNARLQREKLLMTHGERHPEVLKLDAEIKAIERLLARSSRSARLMQHEEKVDPALGKTLQQLQGKWRLTRQIAVDGDPDIMPSNATWEIKGNRLIARDSGGGGTMILRVDESRSPVHVDVEIETEDETGLGLLSVDGDSLKICLREAQKTPDPRSRPEKLQWVAGVWYMELRRMKPGETIEPAKPNARPGIISGERENVPSVIDPGERERTDQDKP